MIEQKEKEKVEIEKLDLIEFSTEALTSFPLNYENESVKEISCIHKLEYVPSRARIPLFEEFYRILVPEGKISIIVCYWSSPRAIQDPMYEFPTWCEQSFLYFNKDFRSTNLLPKIKCHFDFTFGYQADQEVAARSQETQSFWTKRYLNAVNDLQLVMTKKDL